MACPEEVVALAAVGQGLAPMTFGLATSLVWSTCYRLPERRGEKEVGQVVLGKLNPGILEEALLG